MKSLSTIKRKIIPILKRHGIEKAEIFGSYASGKAERESDLDILIKPPQGMSLLELSNLKLELEEVSGLKIDLVNYKYINPYLKKYILKKREVVI